MLIVLLKQNVKVPDHFFFFLQKNGSFYVHICHVTVGMCNCVICQWVTLSKRNHGNLFAEWVHVCFEEYC